MTNEKCFILILYKEDDGFQYKEIYNKKLLYIEIVARHITIPITVEGDTFISANQHWGD